VSDEVVQRIAGNLAQVEVRISKACERSGRSREAVMLVAVSKMRTLEESSPPAFAVSGIWVRIGWRSWRSRCQRWSVPGQVRHRRFGI
jgi:hypothetical protein